MSTEKLRIRRKVYRKCTMMNVCNIRFTQRSVNDTFSNGTPIKWTIHMLQTNQIAPCEIPLIRVGRLDGHWKSIDNRRLYCFKQSGMKKVPVIIMHQLTEEFHCKNQSPNNGVSVQLIHDPKPMTHHQNKVTAYNPITQNKREWSVKEIIEQLTKKSSKRKTQTKAKSAAVQLNTFPRKVYNRRMQARDKRNHLQGARHKATVRKAAVRKATATSQSRGVRPLTVALLASMGKGETKTTGKGTKKMCDVCDRQKDKQNYLKGARHQIEVEAALRKRTSSAHSARSAAIDEDAGIFWCKVCNRTMGANNKNSHLNGARHKSAVRLTNAHSDTRMMDVGPFPVLHSAVPGESLPRHVALRMQQNHVDKPKQLRKQQHRQQQQIRTSPPKAEPLPAVNGKNDDLPKHSKSEAKLRVQNSRIPNGLCIENPKDKAVPGFVSIEIFESPGKINQQTRTSLLTDIFFWGCICQIFVVIIWITVY